MINKQLSTAILAAGVLLASIMPTAAQAVIIYDNITSPATTNGGNPIGPALGPLADSFSVTGSTTTLDTVQLLLDKTSATSGSVRVDLFNDNSGTPGTLNTNIGSVNDSALSTGTFNLFTFTPSISLATGRYWIELSTVGTSSANWAFSTNIGRPGLAGERIYAATQNGGAGFQISSFAFQMRLNNVPEPDTLALISIGLVGVGFSKRRRKLS